MVEQKWGSLATPQAPCQGAPPGNGPPHVYAPGFPWPGFDHAIHIHQGFLGLQEDCKPQVGRDGLPVRSLPCLHFPSPSPHIPKLPTNSEKEETSGQGSAPSPQRQGGLWEEMATGPATLK